MLALRKETTSHVLLKFGKARSLSHLGYQVLVNMSHMLERQSSSGPADVCSEDVKALDFNPSGTSPESRVKALLSLSGTGSNVIVLVGPGGTGKTTILRGIERHRDVRNKYGRGLSLVEVGQQTSLPQLIMALISFVVSSATQEWVMNFTLLALDERNHDQAVDVLVKHLAYATNPMLLLLDDVWCADSRVYRFVQSLMVAASTLESANFKLVVTTRFKDIASTPLNGATIELWPYAATSEKSKRILCGYANLNEAAMDELSHENLSAATTILDKCGGIPLALGIAGRVLGLLRRDGTDQNTPWISYLRCMTKSAIFSTESGLFEIVNSTLSALERAWPKQVNMTPQHLFASLSVFRKHAKIPLGVLTSMWGVEPEHTKLVIKLFCDSNLLSRVSTTGRDCSQYLIHDLICDIANVIGKRRAETLFWHRRLLSRYTHHLLGHPIITSKEDGLGWLDDRILADSYMRDNTIYHLTNGGHVNEAMRLLLDYRWIQNHNSSKRSIPFQHVLDDAKSVFAFVRDAQKNVTVTNGDCSVRGLLKDLKYFIDTLEKIIPKCATSPNQCAFQLHGRLCTPNAETSLFDWCLFTIEKFAEHPWCRPMEGMLQGPEQSLKRVLHTTGVVQTMMSRPYQHEMVIGTAKPFPTGHSRIAAIEVISTRTGQAKTIPNPVADTAHPARNTSHDSAKRDNPIVSLVVHNDEIAALSAQGVISVWKTHAKTREFCPFVHPCRATCMTAVGNDAVACGSTSGNIRVFDKSTWELRQEMSGSSAHDLESMFGPPRAHFPQQRTPETNPRAPRSPVFMSRPPGCNANAQQSICASQDGRLLLSLSLQGNIYKWDLQTGLGCPWDVHSQGSVHCMAMNTNGTLVALGLLDGQIQIYDTVHQYHDDAMDGELSPKKVIAGHHGRVTCILFNQDGTVMYSGGLDKSVQYWDLKKGMRMGRPLREHDEHISSLCLSCDGTELFSASGRRICVSSAQTPRYGNRETGTESGFESKIQAYCLSHDNNIVVTVESDMIRFRDVRDPLTRYEAMRHVMSSEAEEIPSLPIHLQEKVDVVEHVCLSKDSMSIAYSVLRRNLLRQEDSKTNIYVASRVGKSLWGCSRLAPELSPLKCPHLVSASIEKLEFMSDDSLKVVFAPQLGQPETIFLVYSAVDDVFIWKTNDDALDVEDWAPKSHLNLKLGKVVHFGSEVVGILDVEAMPHKEIRGAIAEDAVTVDQRRNRLWVLNKEFRLQYVDLVSEPSKHEIFPPLPLPEIEIIADATVPLGSQNKASCDTFISFAAPDRTSIAMPLGELLGSKGITSFVQSATLESIEHLPLEMTKALEEASIFIVIASPEYPASKAQHLHYILGKRRLATAEGKQGPIIVPVFYRMESSKCQNLNLVSDVSIADATLRRNYESLVSEGAPEIWLMRKNMAELGRLPGIENKEEAMNGTGSDAMERRRRLIARVASMVEAEYGRMSRIREHEASNAGGQTLPAR